MRLEPYGFLTNPFHSAEIMGEWYRYFLTPTMRGLSFKAKAKSVLPLRRVPSRINFGQSFVTIELMIGLNELRIRTANRCCAGNCSLGHQRSYEFLTTKSLNRSGTVVHS